MTTKSITPKTAKTTKELCELTRDNFSFKGYWILVGENNVSITKQDDGWPMEQTINIPKGVFERFIKFYETGK